VRQRCSRHTLRRPLSAGFKRCGRRCLRRAVDEAPSGMTIAERGRLLHVHPPRMWTFGPSLPPCGLFFFLYDVRGVTFLYPALMTTSWEGASVSTRTKGASPVARMRRFARTSRGTSVGRDVNDVAERCSTRQAARFFLRPLCVGRHGDGTIPTAICRLSRSRHVRADAAHTDAICHAGRIKQALAANVVDGPLRLSACLRARVSVPSAKAQLRDAWHRQIAGGTLPASVPSPL